MKNKTTYKFKVRGEEYKIKGVPYEESRGMLYYGVKEAKEILRVSKAMVESGKREYEYGDEDQGLYTYEGLLSQIKPVVA